MSIRSVAQAFHLLMHGFICEVHANCCVHMRPIRIHIYAYRYGHMSTRKGIKLSGELGDSRLLVFFTHEVKNPPENTLAGLAAALHSSANHL